jgi:hypothetical protein
LASTRPELVKGARFDRLSDRVQHFCGILTARGRLDASRLVTYNALVSGGKPEIEVGLRGRFGEAREGYV